MSSEFQEYQLDEVCEFINGFAFKSENYIEKSADTYEVFRMGYISRGGGFKEDSSPVFVTRSNPKLEKYRLRCGDIIIAMTDMKDKVAILGNTARVVHDDRFVLNQRAGLIRVTKPNIICPVFLYYYSNWKPHVDYLRARANSGVQVNLSTGAIKESKLLLPPLSEQKQIGKMLLALDDRITLLRETNATLEAIAQAIFKSWFVDFDPVRAKQEGRVPEGMDEATAALFPDSFEESELGLVPRGWLVGKVGDLAEIKGGKQLEKAEFSDAGPNPVFGGAGVMGHTKLSNAAGLVITVGRVGAYCGQFFWHFGEAWVNNNASRIVPNCESHGLWLYQWLRQADIEYIKKGAAQPFVSNGDVAAMKLVIPTEVAIQSFARIAGSVYERLQLNNSKAQTLATLRDTLLPRLISGQLRLANAEDAISEAVA